MKNIIHRTTCRICGNDKLTCILDLGEMYLQGLFVKEGYPDPPKRKIPLELMWCDTTKNEHACGLVQLSKTVSQDILYSTYWYRSGTNDSMREHLNDIVNKALIILSQKFPMFDELQLNVMDIGCFKSGSKILMGDYTEKNIEDIIKGDIVFSAQNKKRSVINTFRREYCDDFIKIRSYYNYNIECTKEHPILSIKNTQEPIETNLSYIKANELSEGDYIAIPRIKNINNHMVTDKERDIFFIYGWYLAEGSVIYSHKPKFCGINLTFGLHENEHIEMLEAAAHRLGLNTDKSIRKGTIELRIYSKEFAEEIVRLFGKGSWNKKINPEIFELPDELKLILIRNLFLGDGHLRKVNGGEYQYELSSRSNELLNGIKLLLSQFGICSYRYNYKGKPMYMTVSGNGIELLKPGILSYIPKKRYITTDNYILLKIENISIYVEKCNVYNFEVENDNSYIVNGICVHNCNDGTMLSFYPKSFKKWGVDPSNSINDITDKSILKVKDVYPSQIVSGRKFFCITSIAMLYDLEDPKAFVRAIRNNLEDDGIWIFEMSYLPLMINANAFDTICNEHIEYYTLSVIEYLLECNNMKLIDVTLNPTNGGSFQCISVKKECNSYKIDYDHINKLRMVEFERGYDILLPYLDFANKVKKIKSDIQNFIYEKVREGSTIHLYGASTKGNTLLQACNIDNRFIQYAADKNPDKWGAYTLGTNIKIISEEESRKMKPDYYLVLPWHFKESILIREKNTMAFGSKFIFPLPKMKIYPE